MVWAKDSKKQARLEQSATLVHNQDANVVNHDSPLAKTGIGLFQWWPTTNQLEFSASCATLLDELEDELRSELGLFAYIHPDHFEKAQREYKRALQATAQHFEGLYRMRTISDRTQVCLMRAALTHQSDTIVQVSGAVIDVTRIFSLIMQIGK